MAEHEKPIDLGTNPADSKTRAVVESSPIADLIARNPALAAELEAFRGNVLNVSESDRVVAPRVPLVRKPKRPEPDIPRKASREELAELRAEILAAMGIQVEQGEYHMPRGGNPGRSIS